MRLEDSICRRAISSTRSSSVGAIVGARAAGARKGDQERDEENEHGEAERDQRMRGRDLDAEQRDKNFAHAVLVARFEAG